MKTKLFLTLFLTVFVFKSAHCDFSETEFEAAKKDKNVFVLFVKDLQFGEFNHFYLQVKELYDNDTSSSIKFEKVDCTAFGDFCQNQNVAKLMELKYFANDATDNSKMFDFIQKKIDEALKTHADEEAVKEKLTKGKSFVKFFSDNCPRCQSIAEDWTKLEKKYENDERIKIVSVNCIETRMACKKFKIQEYPTIIYVVDGKANQTYSKPMNLVDFTTFIETTVQVDEVAKNKTNYVLNLTPENFNESTRVGVTFVKFNLLGCSHCIVLDNDWKKAAEMVSTVDGLTLAEIECKHCYGFCLTQKASGFPTLNVYKDGELVNHDYHEVMNMQGFYDIAMAYHKGGKDLEDWVKLQGELRTKRKAAERARVEAIKAGNVTVPNPAHH